MKSPPPSGRDVSRARGRFGRTLFSDFCPWVIESEGKMRTDSQGDPLDPRIFERLMNEESLFAEALAKRGDERAAFLDAYCQGDIELRRRVEALLEAADHPDPFLQAPASLAKSTSDAPAPRGPGTMI